MMMLGSRSAHDVRRRYEQYRLSGQTFNLSIFSQNISIRILDELCALLSLSFHRFSYSFFYCARKLSIGLGSLVLAILVSLPCLSQQSTPTQNFSRVLTAVKRPADIPAPVIDGDLSDSVWQRAAKASTFYDPNTDKPTADQSEAYLLYDADYLYVAFYCHDSQPEAIVGRETIRDADLSYDDNIRFDIDPFHTHRREDYAIFTVNPLGTHNIRIGGGRAAKLEWQGEWQSAAKRVKDGWTVEMRIPWGILSYPRSTGKQTMGVNFRRSQQRTKIESMWSNIGPQGFHDREGILENIEPPAQKWKPRLSLLPYVRPRMRFDSGKFDLHTGLDARYQPTPELTGVATINPDFASVEGAVEGIAFTRAERFVPDRRPFFLEGRDYLGFGEDYQIGSFFDSNRIQHVDIGAKAYGKLNPQTTLGVLSTVGFGKEADLVAQLRRDFNATANVNVIVTQRLAHAQDNTVAAISPSIRRGKWSLDGQVAQTFGTEAGGLGWTGAVNLEDKNLFSTLRYRHVDRAFNDRLGYIAFTDYKGESSYTHWGADWRHGYLRNFGVDASTTYDFHIDGSNFRRQASIFLGFETRSDYFIGVHTEGGTFDRDTDFTYGLNIGGSVSNRFRSWSFGITSGKQANRVYTSFGPNFNLRLFRKLDLSVGSFIQNYAGIEQQHIITMNYELSPFRSFGGRIVVENSGVNAYLSYHNSGRRGVDTYFLVGDPNAKRFVSQIMLKLVFAI